MGSSETQFGHSSRWVLCIELWGSKVPCSSIYAEAGPCFLHSFESCLSLGSVSAPVTQRNAAVLKSSSAVLSL